MDVEKIFLILGILLLVAYILKANVAERFHVPGVTLYIILGVILGGSVTGFLNSEIVNKLDFISDLALALIAFSIGVELNKDVLQKVGKSIIIISFFEGMGAFLLVFLSFHFLLHKALYFSLVLGAVASATAPAATVYVIKQFKSKGTLTSTIMGVVGTDDAIALAIYVFASLFASSLLLGKPASISNYILEPLKSISLSVLIGIFMAFTYNAIFWKKRHTDDITMGIISFLLIALAVSQKLHISELLTIMTFGCTLVNKNLKLANRTKSSLDFLTPLFLPWFFTLAAAHLDVSLVATISGMGIVYIVARASGKIIFASLGAVISNAPKTVKKFIGFSLIPQVGVAVALALAVKREFTQPMYGQAGIDMANIIINLLLLTTIFTEIVGPILTYFSLKKAGDIRS